MRERDRGEGEESEERQRAKREADLVANRLEELREKPIAGDFDIKHLGAIHAYIFQDLPYHRPGTIRDDSADTWIKHRGLEGGRGNYDVPYVSKAVAQTITDILCDFGGAEAIRDLPPEQAADRLARLYGDLDHAHGFYEGNSRTLREFTRELADRAGFDLDWVRTSVGEKERNELYVARDLAVLERAYPGLTPERAMQTNDRAEYEASFVVEALRDKVGDRDLRAILRDNLSSREHPNERAGAAPQPDERGLEVFDSATGVISKLVDFVLELLARSTGPVPRDAREDMRAFSSDPAVRRQQRHARIAAEREAKAARRSIERIRVDMEAGRNLKGDDIRGLTRHHQEQIASFGDAAVREMVADARKRDDRHWQGDERER